MNQQVLFHDSIYDALGADIAAAGGFKAVAYALWPAESPTNSATKLRNAINPEQAQKLCPEEVLAIKRLAKEKGSTATIDYEARELSFKVEWVTPEDRIAHLQQAFVDRASALEELAKEIRRSQQLLKAVK